MYNADLQKYADDARQLLGFVNRKTVMAGQRVTEVGVSKQQCEATIVRMLEHFQRLLLDRGKTLLAELQTLADNKIQFYSDIKSSAESIESLLKQVRNLFFAHDRLFR